jgi:hypothetical protein
MGSTNAVRAWLLIQPRPTSLRLTCDGEFRNIPVTSTWAATAQSIEALDADLVEALDDKGNVLRAIKPESLLEEEPERTNETNAAISKAIAIDGETERFRLFATLISDAYKYGYEVAFTKMVELFAAVNSRTESIEKSLATTERMLRKSYEDNLKLQMERAATDGGEGGLASFLTSFIGGMNSGASESETESKKSNGKAEA